jgi:hypothetical protein
MSRLINEATMLAVFVLGCLLSAENARALTVKYEFLRSSPNVAIAGGTPDFCSPGSLLNGTVTITFTDTFIGGNPVTLEAGYACAGGATPITVNTVATGSSFPVMCGCCTLCSAVKTATITSAYNNGVSTKTIVLTNGGSLMPLTLLNNTTDPMFRVSNTLIPGVSTPTTGGFTHSTLPTLSWPAIAGATASQLQVHTDPFFNGPLVNQAVGTNQYTLVTVLLNGVSYYTRVKATSGPFAGVWSYIGDFTVATTAPAAPTTNTPANNANVPVQTPTFNWSAVTSGPE